MQLLRRAALLRHRSAQADSSISAWYLAAVEAQLISLNESTLCELVMQPNLALRTHCDLYYAAHYQELLLQVQTLRLPAMLRTLHIVFRELPVFYDKCFTSGGFDGYVINLLSLTLVTLENAPSLLSLLKIAANFAADSAYFASQALAALDFERYLALQPLTRPALFCFSNCLKMAYFHLLDEFALVALNNKIMHFSVLILRMLDRENTAYFMERLFSGLGKAVQTLISVFPFYRIANELFVEVVRVFQSDLQMDALIHLDFLYLCMDNMECCQSELLKLVATARNWNFLSWGFVAYVEHQAAIIPEHYVHIFLDALHWISKRKQCAVDEAAFGLILRLSEHKIVSYYTTKFDLRLEDHLDNSPPFAASEFF